MIYEVLVDLKSVDEFCNCVTITSKWFKLLILLMGPLTD